MPRSIRRPALAVLVCIALAIPAHAEDPWNPFADSDRRARATRPAAPPASSPRRPTAARPYLAPMSPENFRRGRSETPGGNPASTAPPFDSAPGTYAAPLPDGTWANGYAAEPAVERGDLTPAIATPTSPLTRPSPHNTTTGGLWAGLDATTAEPLLASVRLPPASPAMAALLSRILAQPAADPRLELIRIATLLRAGSAAAEPQSASLASAAAGAGAEAAIATILSSEADLAAGRRQDACARVKSAMSPGNQMPAQLRGDAIVIAGYCAIAAGDTQAGTLAAELARDSGYNRPFTLALLEAVAAGTAPSVALTTPASLIDGLLALSMTPPDPALLKQLAENAEPGLLSHLATSERVPAEIRLAAAERAARRNVISPAALANAYRNAATAPSAAAAGPALERARLFEAAERTEAQFQKTRTIRALLDNARHANLYHPVAAALTPVVAPLPPAQEISWFAETAIEALAAGGDYAGARRWIEFARPFEQGAGNLGHWLMLVDIADANLAARRRGQGFPDLEAIATRGRFSPAALNVLATVLDALDYNVPIPLWNLASRTDQPPSGYLPETGVLASLKQASEQQRQAATLLYALRTIAPEETTATNPLGLGETIRALKRTGLEHDARRLGFEALFGDWPRTALN